ncbi:MAG: CPBP family intramembrane metalloprotease [Bacteroidia bacterium]|nr:CPBP family intramembrane metalloprotease [Bacteroidia bacterium]
MKQALKLFAVAFLLMQVITPFIVILPVMIYQKITLGVVQMELITQEIMVPAQLVATGLVLLYLWSKKQISHLPERWSMITPLFSFWCIAALFAMSWLMGVLMDYLSFLPNIMEQSMDLLKINLFGLLAITVLGPIMEEFLFRGAITKVLLANYSPRQAILLSAALFGVFHLNPAQLVPAFLMGILFAWVFYKTGSLLLCMVMHILNNSISMALMEYFPDIKSLSELFTPHTYWSITAMALLLLVVAIIQINKLKVRTNWSKKVGQPNRHESDIRETTFPEKNTL